MDFSKIPSKVILYNPNQIPPPPPPPGIQTSSQLGGSRSKALPWFRSVGPLAFSFNLFYSPDSQTRGHEAARIGGRAPRIRFCWAVRCLPAHTSLRPRPQLSKGLCSLLHKSYVYDVGSRGGDEGRSKLRGPKNQDHDPDRLPGAHLHSLKIFSRDSMTNKVPPRTPDLGLLTEITNPKEEVMVHKGRQDQPDSGDVAFRHVPSFSMNISHFS